MHRLLTTIFFLAFIATGNALASTPGLVQGKAAFEKGEHKQALGHLLTAFSHEPADPEINFLLGRTYFEMARYEDAVMAFERVLFVNPDSSRVKLEIARAYLALGSKEFARQYFQEVLATNPPEAVWSNIQHFLKSIKDSEQRHFFTGTLALGFDYDDNPRTAPLNDTISLGLLEFQLTGDGAIPEDDFAAIITATLNYIYRPEGKGFFWKTGFLSYNSFYNDENDLNINYNELTTGPSWKSDHFLWQNNLLATSVQINNERYYTSYGAASTLTSQLFERFLVTGKIRFEDKDNTRFTFRSAENYQGTAQAVLLLTFARLGLTYGRELESAENEVVSYDRDLFELRLDTPLPLGIAFYASAAVQWTLYKEEDAVFLEKRDDEQQELATGLSKAVWQDSVRHQSLILSLSHKYTDCESNFDLYTYRRNVSNLSLTYAF
jgi:tetratricopeptide (TPR) repeat protein